MDSDYKAHQKHDQLYHSSSKNFPPYIISKQYKEVSDIAHL
jgi:hypothetical protein